MTSITMSHQQVSRVVKQVGETYIAWEILQETCDPMEKTELGCPEVLYIEGDGLMLHGQKKKQKELHRFQIAEGVQENGSRRELVGTRYVADFSHEKAKDSLLHYLGCHYDLSNTVVLSNSDGGAGYNCAVFEEILGKVGRHKHFRDWYHVQRKCKERLPWANRELRKKLNRALKKHDRENLMLVNTTVRTHVSALIKGAAIVEEVQQRDGSYTVTIDLPVYGTGSLASTVFAPNKVPEAWTPPASVYAPYTPQTSYATAESFALLLEDSDAG